MSHSQRKCETIRGKACVEVDAGVSNLAELVQIGEDDSWDDDCHDADSGALVNWRVNEPREQKLQRNGQIYCDEMHEGDFDEKRKQVVPDGVEKTTKKQDEPRNAKGLDEGQSQGNYGHAECDDVGK